MNKKTMICPMGDKLCKDDQDCYHAKAHKFIDPSCTEDECAKRPDIKGEYCSCVILHGDFIASEEMELI